MVTADISISPIFWQILILSEIQPDRGLFDRHLRRPQCRPPAAPESIIFISS